MRALQVDMCSCVFIWNLLFAVAICQAWMKIRGSHQSTGVVVPRSVALCTKFIPLELLCLVLSDRNKGSGSHSKVGKVSRGSRRKTTGHKQFFPRLQSQNSVHLCFIFFFMSNSVKLMGWAWGVLPFPENAISGLMKMIVRLCFRIWLTLSIKWMGKKDRAFVFTGAKH